MLTHYVLMGAPEKEELKYFDTENIDGIKVYISNYFSNYKGRDKIIGLKHLYWGKELFLKDV